MNKFKNKSWMMIFALAALLGVAARWIYFDGFQDSKSEFSFDKTFQLKSQRLLGESSDLSVPSLAVEKETRAGLRLDGNCRFPKADQNNPPQSLTDLMTQEAQISGVEILPEHENVLNFTALWKGVDANYFLSLTREEGDVGIYAYSFKRSQFSQGQSESEKMKRGDKPNWALWNALKPVLLKDDTLPAPESTTASLQEARQTLSKWHLTGTSSNLLQPRSLKVQKSIVLEGNIESMQADFEGAEVVSYQRKGLNCILNSDKASGEKWSSCFCN
jgi:hypothetical protein